MFFFGILVEDFFGFCLFGWGVWIVFIDFVIWVWYLGLFIDRCFVLEMGRLVDGFVFVSVIFVFVLEGRNDLLGVNCKSVVVS